jgi:hypothetical protein
LLAIFAEPAKARLALNEIAETRAGLPSRLFRDVAVSRHNAEQIHDPVPDLLGLEIAIDCGRGNASTAAQAVSMAATQAASAGRAPRCPCRRPRDVCALWSVAVVVRRPYWTRGGFAVERG